MAGFNLLESAKERLRMHRIKIGKCMSCGGDVVVKEAASGAFYAMCEGCLTETRQQPTIKGAAQAWQEKARKAQHKHDAKVMFMVEGQKKKGKEPHTHGRPPLSLEKCPFCGAAAELSISDVGSRVSCSSCRCQTELFDFPKYAIKTWNRRTGGQGGGES